MLKVTLELKDNPKDIQKIVDGLLVKELNSIVSDVSSHAREQIGNVVNETIKQSPEVQSLNKRKVRGELGLKPSMVTKAINEIAKSVSETTEVVVKKFKKSGAKITGGITVNIQQA